MEQLTRMAIPFQVVNMGHRIEQAIKYKMVCRHGLVVRTPAVKQIQFQSELLRHGASSLGLMSHLGPDLQLDHRPRNIVVDPPCRL